MNVQSFPDAFSRAADSLPLSIDALIALKEQQPNVHGLGAFTTIVTDDMPREIILRNKSDDFSTNWHFARLTHEYNLPKEALAYIQKAYEIEPDNPKVAAKFVEILLDLHDEMPNLNYNYDAYGIACALITLEESPFSQHLYNQVLSKLPLEDLTHDGAMA